MPRPFVREFLLPLVRGGALRVGRPLGLRAVARVLELVARAGRDAADEEAEPIAVLGAGAAGGRRRRLLPSRRAAARRGQRAPGRGAAQSAGAGASRSGRAGPRPPAGADRGGGAGAGLGRPAAVGARSGQPPFAAGPAARDRPRRSDGEVLAGAADLRRSDAAGADHGAAVAAAGPGRAGAAAAGCARSGSPPSGAAPSWRSTWRARSARRSIRCASIRRSGGGAFFRCCGFPGWPARSPAPPSSSASIAPATRWRALSTATRDARSAVRAAGHGGERRLRAAVPGAPGLAGRALRCRSRAEPGGAAGPERAGAGARAGGGAHRGGPHAAVAGLARRRSGRGDLGQAFGARLALLDARASAAGSPRLAAALSIADYAAAPVTRPLAL